jgi:hypothetical protein
MHIEMTFTWLLDFTIFFGVAGSTRRAPKNHYTINHTKYNMRYYLFDDICEKHANISGGAVSKWEGACATPGIIKF